MADITGDFSFAYMKEAFVATLLELARNHGDDSDSDEGSDDDNEDDPLDKYELWRVFKETVKTLREDMGGESIAKPRADERFSSAEMVALLDEMRAQGGSQPSKAASPLEMAHRVPGEAQLPQAQLLGQSVDNGISAAYPMYSFSPLQTTKVSKFNDGVWEWSASS